MKSLITLWRKLAYEYASWCCVDTTQDYNKLLRRVEEEGLSFLTISLPAFAKDFDKALDNGRVGDWQFAGFKRKAGLPLFLGGFLHQVFDSEGVLLETPSIDAIRAIRQLTMVFGKVLLPCSDERVADAFSSYVSIEDDLRDHPYGTCTIGDLIDFERIGAMLYSPVFDHMQNMVEFSHELGPLGLIGQHGPGNTADRIGGNHKWNLPQWTARMEKAGLSLLDYACANPYWANQEYGHTEIVELEHELPVRVVHVPKTLKTPRIIAIEPTCMMFMQKAIANELVENLESQFVTCWYDDPIEGVVIQGRRSEEAAREQKSRNRLRNLAYGLVGFSDQNPNRALARHGSEFGNIATLDLSEASDRVSNRHVELLFGRWPVLSSAIQATRSLTADVPGKGIIPLTKFASMGSALCFPVEAMVFLTIVLLGIERAQEAHLKPRDVLKLRGKVRVYGDDIIVPVEYARHVKEALETFGLKVNVNKSFSVGNFRESCGGDYFRGEWVTPVRFRRLLPRKRGDAQEIISLLSFRNQLYLAGAWETVRWLDTELEKWLPQLPSVKPNSSGLGRVSFIDPYVKPYERLRIFYADGRSTHKDIHDSYRESFMVRDSRTLHAPVVRSYKVVSKAPISTIDGHAALLKCLSRGIREDALGFLEPIQDKRHLERHGRSQTVSIKSAWVALS